MIPGSLDDALFIGQQMPWIDPAKEADAYSTLESRTYMSGPEIIRRRGANPKDVLDQQAKWERQKRKPAWRQALAAQPRTPIQTIGAPQP